MKKLISDIRTLTALLMAGAVMSACSGDSDDDVVPAGQPVNPAPKTYTLTVNASKGDGAAARVTRALLFDGTTLNASWTTTENVYVKKGSTWATGSLNPEANGATATLKGSLTGITIVADDNLTLQFPKSGDITYAGQQGTIADIAANFDWATANVEVASISSTGNINPKAATTTFTNQQTIIKFMLKDKANSAAINPSAFTITDGTSTVELVSIPAATYTTNGDGVLYIAFPAAGSDKTISLTATVGDDTYTHERSGVTFSNGQYYAINVKMTRQAKVPGTDLSMLDCAGNARSSRWTANCYMVHTAGDYKLPLVYGNAIKNGATNAAAYTGVTSSWTIATFPNHKGEAISDPWIKNHGITVSSAELRWQDAEGLVTAVGINGDYLTLTIGKDASSQEGNALIVVKDESNVVAWSWHIWVTKQTFTDLTTIDTGDHIYQLTHVNLGWVGEPMSSTGYCTYYQWGRKDAFKPSRGTVYGNTPYDHIVYDINNNTVTALGNSQSGNIPIEENIKYPITHYYHTSNYCPNNNTSRNFWDAQQTSKDENISTATIKTVYDPCPPGFCVPTCNLYYYLKNGIQESDFAWDETNNGRLLTANAANVFFPAPGYRDNKSGKIQSYGYGSLWSATSSSASGVITGRELNISKYSINYSSLQRSYGCAIRAVAEE